MRSIRFFFVLFFSVFLLGDLAEAAPSAYQTQAERYPQVVTSATFSQLATARIQQALTEAKETRRHEVEQMKIPQNLRFPAGKITYDVNLPNGLRYGTMMPVYVGVLVNGKVYRQGICYFRVHVYQNMVVAAHDLTPNVTLASGDLRLEEREVNSLSARYLTKLEDAEGHVVNRLVREGTMLTEQMILNPVIMETGANIYIVANVNGVQVKMEGVTMQRGRIGDIIRVRNTTSQKVLRARVLDAATVEVL